ncbi:MAG: CHAT domain-containing protein [Candidatus Obscuribacterales bacterium]
MGSKSLPKNSKKRSSMEKLGKQGWEALQSGDFELALTSYSNAVQLAQELEDPAAFAVFISYLGVAKQSCGRLEEAHTDYSQAAQIARDNHLPQIEAHANLLLGEFERDRGHCDEAIQHFMQALDAAYTSEDNVGMEISFGNLGRLYLERGWAEQASEWFRHALEAREETPNRSSWLGSLGLSMAELGLFEEAVSYYSIAFDEAQARGDYMTQAICRGSQGNAFFELKRYPDAIMCYQDALQLSEAVGDGRRVGIWEGNIGTTWLKLDNLDKAIDCCAKAVELAREYKDPQSEAAHLDSLGDCFMAKGEVETALEYYEQALQISEDIDDRQGERIYLSNIGKVYEKREQLQPAFECYEKAINLFDEQRASIKADDLKTSFANRGQELYRDMVKVCLSMDKRVEALEYVGRAKSRALLDLLSNSPIDISELTESPDQSLARLIRRESELRSQIAHFERLFWQGPPASESGSRSATLAPEDSQKIYSEWRDVVNQLRRRHPNYAGLVTATTLNFDEIKSLWTTPRGNDPEQYQLNRRTALLEFYWTDQYIVSAAIWYGKDEPTIHIIASEEDRESFDADLASFLEMSATEGWEVPTSLCKRLYNKLVAPVMAGIPESIDRLLIVPHSSLHHLPFAALHDGKGFLCEKYSISYLPTTSLIPVLAKANRNTAAEGNKYLVSAISDYSATRREGLVFSSRLRSAAGLEDLTYTMEEAQNIFSQTSDAKLLTNDEVKQSLPELFSQYSVVHFAGHAVFNPEEPLASGLVLADGSILTAAAILQGNALRTDRGKLLVLSACQTGVNKITEGGEILGLARALMYAGMPNLVLSLWEVADRSTAELMQEFHKNLAPAETGKQLQIADALRETQRAAAKAGQPVHAWAPFVHLGID